MDKEESFEEYQERMARYSNTGIPTLEGKDADRFQRLMYEVEKNRKPLSKEIKEHTKAILAKAKL